MWISKTTRMLAQKQPFIQRVRNSSLVRGPMPKCPGLKRATETKESEMIGRGALHVGRSSTVRSCGLHGRENAGMSSENKVRILMAEYPKVSG